VSASREALLDIPAEMAGMADRSSCRIGDIGCGSGVLTEALADRYESANVLGVEFAPGAYDVAQRRFVDSENVVIFGGDAQRVLPELRPLDIIYAINMVQDTAAPLRMIRTLSKALSEDGILILTVPDETATDMFPELAGWDEDRELPYMEMTDITVDGEQTSWSQYAFPEDRLKTVFDDCGLSIRRHGRLAADATGLLYPMELLDDDERREWAQSVVEEQRTNPSAGPEISLYVLEHQQ
jgi:SAM-dependent methyltransferase